MQLQGQNHLSSGTTISFAEFESVNEAFLFLTSQLMLLLAKTNFFSIKRSCIEQINTPNGAQLPPELVTRIKACENVTKLFEVLAGSAYWSWFDIRLLKAMAVASGSVEAIKLISSYSKTIFSKKLCDLLPNAPSKGVKEKWYTEIVTILNKNPNDVTVADLLEFESVIRYHQFGDLLFQSLKIGQYPVIHDPLSSYNLAMSIPSPPVNNGKLCMYVHIAMC